MAGPRVRNADGTAAPDPVGPQASPGARSPSSEQRQRDEDSLQVFRKALGRCETPHEKRCSRFRQYHNAYKGELDESRTAPIRPRGIVLPRYAYQAGEVLISNLVDDNPVGKVIPTAAEDVPGAEAMGQTVNYFRRRDHRDPKMVKFIRQAVVMGMSPGKVYWRHDVRKLMKRTWVQQFDGSVAEEDRPTQRVTDGPSFAPLPVWDFMYDPSASTTDEMGYVLARYWVTMGSLRDAKDEDGTPIYRNLGRVSDTQADWKGEQRSSGRDHQGRIEVFEFWSRTRLIVVANRSVVIRDEPNPFDHGEIPFICANTTPDLYTCDGISTMDLLRPLQATAWDILNQMLRNVDLANLLMVKINRTSRFDEKQLANADVGASFMVDSKDDVDFWYAGGNILEPGMETLNFIKTTMQETTGTNVYLAGGASGTVDSNTATEYSGMASMASKLVLGMRSAIGSEIRRMGMQEIGLIQQFLPRPIQYRIDGSESFSTVMPWEIQGEYDYDIDDMASALNKQVAQQSAMQLVNLFIAGAPAMAPSGIVPNWRKLYGGALCAFDIRDENDYFQNAPQPMQVPAGPPQLPPGNPNGAPQPLPAPPAPTIGNAFPPPLAAVPT